LIELLSEYRDELGGATEVRLLNEPACHSSKASAGWRRAKTKRSSTSSKATSSATATSAAGKRRGENCERRASRDVPRHGPIPGSGDSRGLLLGDRRPQHAG
jgi:hypothetical protein